MAAAVGAKDAHSANRLNNKSHISALIYRMRKIFTYIYIINILPLLIGYGAEAAM